jgi:hypothetical protein
MILFLFNESEDPLFNSEIVEISISPIDFDRNKYELLFIFIYHCPNVLALIEMDESDIKKNLLISNNDSPRHSKIYYNFPELIND